MWNPFKRKKKVPPPAPPKPTHRRVTTELAVINNKSDKRYDYKSINDFGLIIEYVSGFLIIKQRTQIGDDNWEKLAMLNDFSIIKYEFTTFQIPQ
jgi:hypothetical protein